MSLQTQEISKEIRGTSYKIKKNRIKNKVEVLLPNPEHLRRGHLLFCTQWDGL